MSHADRAKRDIALGDAISEELDRIRETSRSDREYLGLTSGLGGLDALTGGWQPGNLTVLAWRPGMGKSSVALSFASHAAFQEGAAVLFCSLEMGTSETVQRHLATETNITTDRLRRGRQ